MQPWPPCFSWKAIALGSWPKLPARTRAAVNPSADQYPPWRLCAAGVDVAALLSKVGLQVTDTSEKVGTVAIAYAAHKALSPVRFPPTVALTPLVARWLGQKPAAAAEGSADRE
jgi:hypothetical protein